MTKIDDASVEALARLMLSVPHGGAVETALILRDDAAETDPGRVEVWEKVLVAIERLRRH